MALETSFGLVECLTTTLSIYLTYLLGLVIYRLYFHPLAKFPGSKLAAISCWHEVYYDVLKQGKFYEVVEEYHKKYGPIVRINPDEIHIRDASYFDTVYTKAGRVDKYDWSGNRFNNGLSTFGTTSAELHAIRRGALTRFFSRARIVSLETIVRDKVKKMVDGIRSHKDTGKVLRIDRAFTALTGDVMMQYAFAQDYDHLSSPGFETTFLEAMLATAKLSNLTLHFPLVTKSMMSIPETVVARLQPMIASLLRFQGHMRGQVSAAKSGRIRETKQSEIPTIFEEILEDPNLPPSEKSAPRLADEAFGIVGAGVLTSAWSLSTGCFYITRQPDVFKRLRAELEAALPDPDTPLKWIELEKLPYLTACIRESLRMSTPVSGRTQRVFHTSLSYNGWQIPPGTPVSLTPMDLNLNKEIFPEPMKFRPERWLGSPKAPDGSSLDRYFVPFNKGSRACLGINLAYAEMYLALAAVFRNFKFELHETDESDIVPQHDFFVPLPKLDSAGVQVKCVQG